MGTPGAAGSMASVTDPQTAAFHRLLADAHHGGQAKVDVLVALVQRTVFVVPWPGGIEGYRSLVNSDGVAALPIFSLYEELEEAARRYGWLDADGSVPSFEIGARAALHYAIEQNLAYVVLDIAAEHVLEISREEFEPLLTPAARRDSSGPYAASGRISDSVMRAVRPTPPPGSVPAVTRTPPQQDIQPPAEAPEIAPAAPAEAAVTSAPAGAGPADEEDGFTVSADFSPTAGATFGGGTSATLSGLVTIPADAIFDKLAAVLRGYPEVEWAALANAARGPAKPVPTICVRVDTSFRQRVNDLITELRQAADAQGAALDVLLLDDADLMRTARSEGIVFYPWRKK